MNETELLLLIEDTRQKLQWAQDEDEVEISTNLLFGLMQMYESLYQLRYEIIFNQKLTNVS